MKVFLIASRYILLPMALILPFWLILGRGLVGGSSGWVAVVYFFYVAPPLILSLLAMRLLVKTRVDALGQKHFGKVDSMLLSTVYLSVFLHGFFLVDGGDTEESVASVVTQLGVSNEVSEFYGEVFFLTSLLLIIVTLAVLIYERTRRPFS